MNQEKAPRWTEKTQKGLDTCAGLLSEYAVNVFHSKVKF